MSFPVILSCNLAIAPIIPNAAFKFLSEYPSKLTKKTNVACIPQLRAFYTVASTSVNRLTSQNYNQVNFPPCTKYVPKWFLKFSIKEKIEILYHSYFPAIIMTNNPSEIHRSCRHIPRFQRVSADDSAKDERVWEKNRHQYSQCNAQPQNLVCRPC
eukprot:6742415-Ditylum_brightwellii.AAC.1